MKQSRSRKRPTRDQQQHKAQVRSHGLLVTTLVLIALFATFLVYIRGRSREQPAAPAHRSGNHANSAAAAQQPQPKYDFYQELPKRRVEVPGENPPPQKTAAAKPAPSKKPDNGAAATKKSSGASAAKPASHEATATQKDYLVQAGAFKLYSQADRVKARLALLGIEAHIDGANSRDSSIYRVRIGPLSDAAADHLRQRLSSHHINSIKLKND